MWAKAALSRVSLTTERSVGGSAFGATGFADVALRPKSFFTHEGSWLRLLDVFIFCWIWDFFLN